MSNTAYHWCVVSKCKNTSKKTPGKLWINVPIVDTNLRNTWLKLAGRDPKSLSHKTPLYFCEDHFDLENDMENYVQYKVMGSVKRIRMKPNCVPSKFIDCVSGRKRKSSSSEPLEMHEKRQKLTAILENEKILQEKENVIASTSTSHNQDLTPIMEIWNIQNTVDKAVQVVHHQQHKAIQVWLVAKYRSKQVQTVKKEIKILKTTVCTATSPLKVFEESENKLCTPTRSAATKKLNFMTEDISDSRSYTPSISGSTNDQDFSPYKLSNQSKTTSDTSSLEDIKKVEKINLQSTISKIINKPKLYIGIPKQLYFLVDLIKTHTNISKPNILLCLMKLKLNRTFSQLADDFDMSITQASNIFYNKMPEILKVLQPFIRQFTAISIKRNLPISFRHKFNQVTCIIDCFEIEIQKPSKSIHQALTWSDYKNTNTIKYLVSCTPDGLVSFVSPGYAGRISDINLLEHSKFLDCLQPGACILADRGFKHLEQCLSQKGFILLRPPSVTAGSKLSKAEAKHTKQIASLRIHIERVIRRIREFGILKQHAVINSNLVGMLDICIKIACALINIQDSLIK